MKHERQHAAKTHGAIVHGALSLNHATVAPSSVDDCANDDGAHRVISGSKRP